MSGSRVVAICGGIGGAKLGLGLYRLLPPGDLTVIVNVGDDFRHLGLHISPDIDTVLYTLAGLSHPDQGWGRHDESWNFMVALAAIGGDSWFALGDRDLALHVERTRRLDAGEGLGFIIGDFASALGITATILPATDHPVATMVRTDEGVLAFQDYFVRLRCGPRVIGIEFAGTDGAMAHPGALAAIASPMTQAIVLCPSNPYLSIDPILAVPGFRQALRAAPCPVVAVTPIIAGRAVKGPTAKIMQELGIAVSPASVAQRYGDFLNGFLVDTADQTLAATIGLPAKCADTLMVTLEDRIRVARAVLQLAATIGTEP